MAHSSPDIAPRTEALCRLADLLDQLEIGHKKPTIGFSMSHLWGKVFLPSSDHSGHGCGTVACIAGWALHSSGEPIVAPPWGTSHNMRQDSYIRAADLLHLDHGLASDLFLPSGERLHDDRSAWESTPSDAARVLRHLAATGEVCWSVPPASAAEESSQ